MLMTKTLLNPHLPMTLHKIVANCDISALPSFWINYTMSGKVKDGNNNSVAIASLFMS